MAGCVLDDQVEMEGLIRRVERRKRRAEHEHPEPAEETQDGDDLPLPGSEPGQHRSLTSLLRIGASDDARALARSSSCRVRSSEGAAAAPSESRAQRLELELQRGRQIRVAQRGGALLRMVDRVAALALHGTPDQPL